MAESSRIPRFGVTPLLLTGEAALAMALCVWLLAQPRVFLACYELVCGSTRAADAEAVVRWQRTSFRERSLNLALRDGQFSQKELKHYSDVRRWLQRVPLLATFLPTALAVASLTFKTSRADRLRVHKTGLIVWLIVAGLAGVIAWWNWQGVFALVHRPFFGERSWRLPNSAYSLALFPPVFWSAAFGLVLLSPALLYAVVIALSGVGSFLERSAPARASEGRFQKDGLLAKRE